MFSLLFCFFFFKWKTSVKDGRGHNVVNLCNKKGKVGSVDTEQPESHWPHLHAHNIPIIDQDIEVFQ